MAEREVIHLPTRRLRVELDIHVPNSTNPRPGSDKGEFRRAVAHAVREELQRTRRD